MTEPQRNFRFAIDEDIVNRIRIERQQALENIRNRRRGNVNGLVGDTVGIELESIALSREYVGELLNKLPGDLGDNFKVHRDGSSEMNIYPTRVGNDRNSRYLSISSHTKEAQTLFGSHIPTKTVGYELISIPMDIEIAELSLNSLLPILENSGDFISERCATHVHVGGMKNLGFLKHCLSLGLWFDEVFYSLAGMGDKFRGYSNNAIYARPLQNGPYFKYNGNYYQTLNWEKALKAGDLFEFFACYGANINRELGKYHPGRYFSINLYSIPRIGTVEFRHFNQSFNPRLVASIVKLCQMFVEVAMRAKSKEILALEPGDVFELHSSSYYLDKLYRFIDLSNRSECKYNLNGDDIAELEHIIHGYKGIGIKDCAVYTHCRDFNVDEEVIDVGNLNTAKSKPIPAGETSIHNIKYVSILNK
jgi:hypothetical protein